MYTCNDIRQRVILTLERLGYFWIKDEILHRELPVTYWSNKSLYLKIQITERQNAVYFDVTKFADQMPSASDERWINLYSFSDEFKRRTNMSIAELMKLVPSKKVGCIEQLEQSTRELPELLGRASAEILRH